MATVYTEREGWLNAAVIALQHEVFPAAGIEPASWEKRRFRVSCGFPIGYRGSRTGKVVLGQAFDPSISGDGTMEVFINPILDKPADVLSVLTHEFVHVWTGIECGHRGAFAEVSRLVGLTGKMTATVPSAELAAKLQGIADLRGSYPHARIDPNSRRKQGTRLLKLQCGECAWTARVSALQANRLHAASACPVCGSIDTLKLED